MKQKETLYSTGAFADDPAGYRRFLVDNVASSTAIEIGPVSRKLMKDLKKHSRRPQKIALQSKASRRK